MVREVILQSEKHIIKSIIAVAGIFVQFLTVFLVETLVGDRTFAAKPMMLQLVGFDLITIALSIAPGGVDPAAGLSLLAHPLYARQTILAVIRLTDAVVWMPDSCETSTVPLEL